MNLSPPWPSSGRLRLIPCSQYSSKSWLVGQWPVKYWVSAAYSPAHHCFPGNCACGHIGHYCGEGRGGTYIYSSVLWVFSVEICSDSYWLWYAYCILIVRIFFLTLNDHDKIISSKPVALFFILWFHSVCADEPLLKQSGLLVYMYLIS